MILIKNYYDTKMNIIMELENATQVEIVDLEENVAGQYPVNKLKHLPPLLPKSGMHSKWERVQLEKPQKQKSAMLIASRLSMLKTRMKLNALQASEQVSDGDRKNPDNWITIRGRKVFIEKGQSKSDAAKNFLDKVKDKEKQTKTKEKPKDTTKNESKTITESIPRGDKTYETDLVGVSPDVKKRIEDAISKTPEEHLKHTQLITIEKKDRKETFGHQSRAGSVYVYGGLGEGIEGVFHHEVQHSVWTNIRTKEQKHEWMDFIDKFVKKHGKAPSPYVDTFLGKEDPETAYLSPKRKKLEAFRRQRNIDNGAIDMKTYFGDQYQVIEENIGWAKRSIENSDTPEEQKKFLRGHLVKLETRQKEFQTKFDNTSLEEKKRVAEIALKRFKKGGKRKAPIYYNEAHSDVGAFIRDKESTLKMRDNWPLNAVPSNWDSWGMDERLMAEAAEGYRRIFGDD